MYKYHFYISKLHLALGIGADFKYTINNTIVIKDHNKSDFLEYTDLIEENEDGIIFSANSLFSNLNEISFQICPKFGLDIYPTKFLVSHLFLSISPLTTYADTPKIRAYAGFGLSYLIPFKRENETKFLQYYKK